MGRPTQLERHQAVLRGLPAAEIADYLTVHSGLPGPRSNLEALQAFGDVAPTEVLLEFCRTARRRD
ncbi:hypothetical protein [Agromyces sp. NPDC058064]|uniref:hypothetical protein n=1 Tax=Agromyces sp. NPDC058064 TaxID=3346322 RepID=UPI0036DC8361